MFLILLTACNAPSHPPPYQGIKIGKPYVVGGHVYVPKYNPGYDEIGVASWYGPGFHGGHTASGERYNQYDLTAAHKTLPLPSLVRVTNLDNGRSAIIRVNDRGPFAHGRIIDLSRASAEKLGVIRTGTAKVRVQFLDAETREYVSRLPNGAASLAALDRLKRVQTAPPEVAEKVAPEIFPPTQLGDVEPLPFAAPKPVLHGNDYVNAQYYGGTQKPEPMESHSVTSPAEKTASESVNWSGYFVQAGTFSVKGNAERLKNELAGRGSVKIMENIVNGRPLYCVLVGPYSSKAEASQEAGKLATIGVIGTKVVRL